MYSRRPHIGAWMATHRIGSQSELDATAYHDVAHHAIAEQPKRTRGVRLNNQVRQHQRGNSITDGVRDWLLHRQLWFRTILGYHSSISRSRTFGVSIVARLPRSARFARMHDREISPLCGTMRSVNNVASGRDQASFVVQQLRCGTARRCRAWHCCC